MDSEVRSCTEYGSDCINGSGERETIDHGLDGIEGKDWNRRSQNNGTDGIYESDGESTTDGWIYTHGADLSDEIDGTYENDRKGVFFLIDVMKFQK